MNEMNKHQDQEMTAVARIEHYTSKCREHLDRVFFSYRRARQGTGAANLSIPPDKLDSVLNEVHLIALKAEFELFLNRVLVTLTVADPSALPRIGVAASFVQDVADALATNDGNYDELRRSIVDSAVPRYGLGFLATSFKKLTGTELKDVLFRKESCLWPQIFAAFEVRHLVEHRDSKVDTRFRSHLQTYWPLTSWSDLDLATIHRVRVREVDIDTTYRAMLASATEIGAVAVARVAEHDGSTRSTS